jgi:hypothetical protein
VELCARGQRLKVECPHNRVGRMAMALMLVSRMAAQIDRAWGGLIECPGCH